MSSQAAIGRLKVRIIRAQREAQASGDFTELRKLEAELAALEGRPPPHTTSETVEEETTPTTSPPAATSPATSPTTSPAVPTSDKSMLLKQLQQLKAGTRAKDAEIAKLKAILAESEPKYEEYQRILKETEEKSETAKKLQIDITACEAELSSLSPTAGMVVVMTLLQDEEKEKQKLQKRKADLESELHDYDLQLKNLRARASQMNRFALEQEHHALCEKLRKQNEIITVKQKEVEDLAKQVEGEEQQAIERSLNLLRFDDAGDNKEEEEKETNLIDQKIQLLKLEMKKLQEISELRAKREAEAKEAAEAAKVALPATPTITTSVTDSPPLSTSPAPELLKFCPECGTKSQNKKFCMECGTSLIKKATPTPPTTPTPSSAPTAATATAPVPAPATDPTPTPATSTPAAPTPEPSSVTPLPVVIPTLATNESPKTTPPSSPGATKSSSPSKAGLSLSIPKTSSPSSLPKASPRTKTRPPAKKATYVKGEPVRPSSTKTAGVVAKAATFCKECGKKNMGGKFCLDCGAVFPMVVSCGNCGAKVTGQSCSSCGEKVDENISYHPITITWPYHSYVQSNIQVYASFDGWQHPHMMSKKSTGQGWEVTLLLPSHITSFLCMFKISGTWFYDLGQTSRPDEHGIVRNLYELNEEQQ